jgi:tungstate transport system ATP-binding protein
MVALYELKNLRFEYQGRTVLSIDHFGLGVNAVTGLAGPNGSGKSTLLRLLGFIARPSTGHIFYDGRISDPFGHKERGEVALLPQEAYLLRRTVYQNIVYGLKIRHNKTCTTELVHEALDLVGLTANQFIKRPWYALSGGEARRVALAARLVLRPRVLLLDEPNASVDATSAQLIKEAALYAHRHWGTHLIIASHDLAWLQEICQDMIHLFNGQIVGNASSTLLFGPWQKESQNRVCMPLDENQRFIAQKKDQIHPHCVAAVDPGSLILHTQTVQIAPDQAYLQGTVTTLGLDKASQRVRISVTVGHTIFHCFFPQEPSSAGNVMPGQKVWLAYRPDEVLWFDQHAD